MDGTGPGADGLIVDGQLLDLPHGLDFLLIEILALRHFLVELDAHFAVLLLPRLVGGLRVSHPYIRTAVLVLHIVVSKGRVAPYATVGIGMHFAGAVRVDNAVLCDGRYVMQPRGCRNPRCGIPCEASGDKKEGIRF